MKLALKNILRRKGRSLYAIIGIAIAISVIVAMTTISEGVRTGMEKLLKEYRGDLLVMEKDSVGMSKSLISEDLRKPLEQIEGVKQADPYSITSARFNIKSPVGFEIPKMFEAMMPNIPHAGIMGMKSDNELFNQMKFKPENIRLSANNENEIIIGASVNRILTSILENLASNERFADFLKKFLGVADATDKTWIELADPKTKSVVKFKYPLLVIKDIAFKIIGTFETGTFQDTQTIIKLKDFQTLNKQKNIVNAFLIWLEDDADEDAVKAGILEIDSKEKLWAKKPEMLLNEYSNQIETMEKILWAMMILAAFSGSIGVLNTMASNISERTKEIGLLQAVGWSKFMIVRIIIFEGLLLAIIGGIFGIILGVIEIHILEAIIQENPIPQGFQFSVILQGFLISLIVGVVGSFIPAFRAARLYPVEALRFE